MSKKYYKVTFEKTVKLHLIVALDPDQRDIEEVMDEMEEIYDDLSEFEEDSGERSHIEMSKQAYDREAKEGMWQVYEPEEEGPDHAER